MPDKARIQTIIVDSFDSGNSARVSLVGKTSTNNLLYGTSKAKQNISQSRCHAFTFANNDVLFEHQHLCNPHLHVRSLTSGLSHELRKYW